MRIAITADTHLRQRDETPERYNALENILVSLERLGIKKLIIAGDTFDKGFSNYVDFEKVCGNHPEIEVLLIPGNHDPQIEKRFFASSQIRVFDKPAVESIDDFTIVFIPYKEGQTMDAHIAQLKTHGCLPEKWILIGHGEYITKKRVVNPTEPNEYMFISQAAIGEHKPAKVILGHIHKPSEIDRVIYPGSPYPIDITETGKRRFIIYDSQTNQVEDVAVSTERIYFIESIMVFPDEDEIDKTSERIDTAVSKWGLSQDELKKVKLRLNLIGYCTDKPKLEEALRDHLKELGIELYEKDGLDLSGLKVASDLDEEKRAILERASMRLSQLSLDGFHASKDQIIEMMMKSVIECKQ